MKHSENRAPTTQLSVTFYPDTFYVYIFKIDIYSVYMCEYNYKYIFLN